MSRKVRLLFRYFGLLIQAVISLFAIWLTLKFSSHRPVTAHIARAKHNHSLDAQAIEVAWAVRQAGKLMPFATCLPRALTTQYLLARSGTESAVRVGAVDSADDGFQAHAWVVSDGRILIGGSEAEVARYRHLVDL